MYKALVFLIIAAVSVTSAAASSNVLEVATLNALRSVTVGGIPLVPNVVNVQAYSTLGDGGGGLFVRGGTICTDDGGVVIQETTGTTWCWYRQFSGPVHLSWYGAPNVADGTINPTCYTASMPTALCDSTAIIKKAFAAAAVSANRGGDGGVTTDGRSVALLSYCDHCDTNVSVLIPSDQYLTCDGPPGVSRGQGTGATLPVMPFYDLPHSLVLNPAFTISRQDQSRLSNCIIRPTWYYRDNTTLNIPAQNVRDTVNIVHNFTGTATSCVDRACNMDNMFIIGFDVCENSSMGNKTIVKDVVEDCLINEWQYADTGGMKLQNFTGGSFLENGFQQNDSLHAQNETWKITNVVQSGTDGVTVTIDTTGVLAANSPIPNDTVLISGLSAGTVAPVSANGHWLVSSVTGTGLLQVTLSGASWAGPTYTFSTWKMGVPAVAVYDSTNIIPGQYICSSGTAPFCTPPTGFGFSSVGSSNLNSLHTSGTGYVSLASGSLSGWPRSGLVQVGTENMRYTISGTGILNITERGSQGTTAATHTDPSTMLPAAPVVIGVYPTSETAVVSAPAQSSGTGTVTFANDVRVYNPSSAKLGTFALNPAYHMFTAQKDAGSNPSGTLVVYASGSGSTITPTKNCFKIQPGMAIYDLTAAASLSTVASVNCAASAVVIASGTVSFSNHKLRFSGCGYPVVGGINQVWLGNCAATSVLLGSTLDPTDFSLQAQGVTCEYLHTSSSEIAVHMFDASAISCANFVLDDDGPTGAQADPDSVGVWFDGKTTKSQFMNGRLGGYYTSMLDSPAPGSQPDGITVADAQVAGNIVLGSDSNAALGQLHGQINAPNTASVFASGSIGAVNIVGSQLPQWSIYVDDISAWPKLFCAANLFADSVCTQARSVPTCVSTGCVSVIGNDNSFDITTSGGPTATSISVALSGQYPATPVCSVSSGTDSGGNAESASISSINWQPWGTIVTFKTIATVTQLYGSCRGVTG